MKDIKTNMIEFRMHYNKALKVVNSCTKLEHVLGAERYVHLLASTYSVDEKGKYTFESSRMVEHINYLLSKLSEKRREYSC